MDKIKFSETGKHEYCCTVVKLKDITPIENSDFLASTLVNGLSIVVRKDECTEGDVMIYVSNESALNKDFLRCNNLFSDTELNSDPVKKGFFNKHGRVKLLKLRGTYSYGFLFKPSDLLKWKPDLDISGFDSLVGQDFDTIEDELFVKAYVPELPERRERSNKRNNKLKRFDKLIPDTFSFHYDTTQLAREIERIDPSTQVSISVKLHGTSAIFANIPVHMPLKLNIFQKLYYWIAKKPTYETKYDLIYSSRTVIKNQYINDNSLGYYPIDLWKEAAEKFKDFIPEGFTVYGEIVGYNSGISKFIQKGYDYSCAEGDWKFMPYRITTDREWNVEEVKEWTETLVKEHPDIKRYVQVIPILYTGTLKDRYNTTDPQVILQKMKNDFGLEKREPLCRCKVPREGIVLRIKDDPLREAFKLKSNAFMDRESTQIDNGEVDMELQEGEGY